MTGKCPEISCGNFRKVTVPFLEISRKIAQEISQLKTLLAFVSNKVCAASIGLATRCHGVTVLPVQTHTHLTPSVGLRARK